MSRRLPTRLVWALLCATILLSSRTAIAQSEPVKPYIVFITDVSGSMGTNTGFGPASCLGSASSRLDHAKCAIYNIASSYGEMVMALGRFRQTSSDTSCANGCSIAGVDCDPDNDGTGCTQDSNQSTGCQASFETGDRFEVLVPILEGNQSDIAEWVDFQCGTCTNDLSSEPELLAEGWTPLAGSLVGARRYWQGLASETQGPYWTGPGDDPIRDDPLNQVFVNGEQCRPYITILLTDGEETCASSFSDTTAAAASLLATDVDGQTYAIRTKPIGFGIAPGNGEIEAIAHAGGEPDGPGNEGAYAQNEEELQLEISQIIADAIKFEQCNDLDDDCDTLVDEDFPNKGAVCDDGELGVCRGTGTFVCNAAQTGTECVITDPGGAATTETCDGLDNDCDGVVDEGACGGCGQVELCNGVDDDCDGAIDEDLVRPCGTDLGICEPGTETCVGGVWQGCTADPLPGENAEQCNGLDDDCDGTVDGFAEECSDLPGGNPDTGPCHPGTHVCPADGSGTWGPCIGEVGPTTEACDLVDNDCDGMIDEDTGGADCSSNCGVGVTVCVDGNLECDSMPDVDDETCNGIDDDCDGLIDEDAAPGGSCDGGGLICDGELVCLNGGYVCVGESIEPELCNCTDDDCDTLVDEGTICPPGSACVDPSTEGYACQCAEVCDDSEFPCPVGRICVDGYCLVDPCAGVTCEPDGNGDRTECVVGECVRSCDLVDCPAPLICYGPTGECAADDCTTFPDRCAADELCVGGTCIADACAGVDCPADQYCVGGACHGSCADVECPAGERCRLGECEDAPCDVPCTGDEVCNEASGECVEDPCRGVPCGQGQWCNPQSGDCELDPCFGVECPGADEVCVGGTCFGPGAFVDAGAGADADPDFVSAGGGGGCSTSGSGGAGGGALVVLAVAGLVLRRRALRLLACAGLVAPVTLVTLVTSGGCDRNTFCIDCPSGESDAAVDAPRGDAGLDAGDGGTPPDACIPTGAEVCNELDDDCDGVTDEDIAEVGAACGTAVGQCTEGVIECSGGELRCTGTPPSPEECDDIDNDCDGVVDDGNPEGGATCGTDVGECVAGVTTCVAGGVLDCVGDVGAPGLDPEICDGKDNDCDTLFDEDIPTQGPCNFPDTGECAPGVLTCVGGEMQCVGGQGPTFELCDALDQDCDGDPTNGYDLDGDVRNCGSCGHSCVDTIPNATERCTGGACAIASCDPGWHDDPAVAGPDCGYACDFQGPVEQCNLVDDDCDGLVDEDVAPPPICEQTGACAGTVATCTAAGWDCVYAGDVSVDGDGNLQPETECDGVDNDCDGEIDESHPDVGAACVGGGLGVCQDRGHLACNTADEAGPTICVIDDPGEASSPEICDFEDDDCDGTVDEGAATGALQEWVAIGGGREIMKYEASRPDARAGAGGVVASYACSRAGVQPWTGLTHPEAEAACAAIGARLCTEQEWHRACSVVGGTTYPVAAPTGTTGATVLEAEDHASLATGTAGGTLRTWVPDYTAGFSGISALRASPDTGGAVAIADAPAQAPRLDYPVTIAATGTYYVWVRIRRANTNQQGVHLGINATLPGTATRTVDNSSTNVWQWRVSGSFTVGATGTYFVSVWMQEDGVKIDQLAISRQNTAAPTATTANGGDWSFATSPDTYVGTTCNGADSGAGAVLDTGAKASCHAAWPPASGGGVFDLSGNVKEWTLERLPAANPIRGGAYNNISSGIACAMSFTLADDAFFFDNVGFRCCR